MKHKIFALILALTVASWAQTATQTTPALPQTGTPAEKAKCACCDKMAASSSKDGMSCSRHGKNADAKGTASCCDKDKMSCCGKDAKPCMKDDKTAASCCKEGCGKDKTASASAGKGCCGQSCDKGCCSRDKKDKTAKNCCGHEIRG
jgi:hypothetical protein